MAKARGDFTDILLRRQILSPEQLEEARGLANQTGAKIQDALLKLEYATLEQVMRAIAEFHNMPFVDLTDVTVPASVIELVPESVARENIVFPLAEENGALKLVLSDPGDGDALAKLQFILQRDLQPALAPREQIVEAINRHYGQTETESVDSMLQEFTDTAIDFTETEQTAVRHPDEKEDDEAPVVKPVRNLIIQEAVSVRERHSRRTVRRSHSHSLPHRRRAGSSATALTRAASGRCSCRSFKIMARMDIAEENCPSPGRPYQR